MKYTLSELLTELLKRNNMGAYVGQNQGLMSWMWMGGENNSMVLKGSCLIDSMYSLRQAFQEIRSATIDGWSIPDKLTVDKINQILNRKKNHETSLKRHSKWSRSIILKASTAACFTF